MSWVLFIQLILILILVVLLITAMVSSWISDIYEGRTTLEMGKANNWRPIKTPDDASTP